MNSGFDFHPRTRVVFGIGAFARLGALAREAGFCRTLLVADEGMKAAGYVAQAVKSLEDSGVAAFHWQGFGENPDSAMVEAGRVFAAPLGVDSVIGLGGGSSLDCAKGVNFLLTNGGAMADYRGYGKATKPLLPMIGVPTTSGTGSEGQSYALISDAVTHEKMACGNRDAAFKIALLDPVLTVTQPSEVTAMTGFDAIAHAVETFVTKKRNPVSQMYSREAWRLLSANYERVLVAPDDLEARAAMQLGAYYAGVAIEHSMLGAAHACANPLTQRYGTAHGAALAMLLPSVARWNESFVVPPLGGGPSLYAGLELNHAIPPKDGTTNGLPQRLAEFAAAGGLPARLRDAGIPREDLPVLAAEAAKQWTGAFNPRPFDYDGAVEIYECAY
jgi:alcohol dehydrogenase